MSDPWEVHVFENRRPVFQASFSGPIEIGRQDQGEPEPYGFKPGSAPQRLVIARLQEDRVPRKYVRVEPQADGTLLITNLSPRVPLRLEQGPTIPAAGRMTLAPPLTLLIEQRGVRIQAVAAPASNLKSLPDATLAPFQAAPGTGRISQIISGATDEVENFVRWLQTALGVLQSAAGASDFFDRAAKAVVSLIGLDSCGVVLRVKGSWRVETLQTADNVRSEADWQPSRYILDRILQDRRTFWELPGAQATGSLIGVKALVAAPILDRGGEVIGVLYGDRVGTGGELRTSPSSRPCSSSCWPAASRRGWPVSSRSRRPSRPRCSSSSSSPPSCRASCLPSPRCSRPR